VARNNAVPLHSFLEAELAAALDGAGNRGGAAGNEGRKGAASRAAAGEGKGAGRKRGAAKEEKGAEEGTKEDDEGAPRKRGRRG
jgi:hypothetical protein